MSCCRWSAACGGEFDDLLRGGDVEAGEQVLLGLGQLGALAEHAGGAGEGAGVEPVEVAARQLTGLGHRHRGLPDRLVLTLPPPTSPSRAHQPFGDDPSELAEPGALRDRQGNLVGSTTSARKRRGRKDGERILSTGSAGSAAEGSSWAISCSVPLDRLASRRASPASDAAAGTASPPSRLPNGIPQILGGSGRGGDGGVSPGGGTRVPPPPTRVRAAPKRSPCQAFAQGAWARAGWSLRRTSPTPSRVAAGWAHGRTGALPRGRAVAGPAPPRS